MERVKKGEMYWSIYIIASSAAQVYQTEEKNNDDDNDNFKYGNYFINKEDAMLTANKINKIFKGADTIEIDEEKLDGLAVEYENKMYGYSVILGDNIETDQSNQQNIIDIHNAFITGYRKAKEE